MYYLTSEAVELLEAYRGPGKGRSIQNLRN